MIFSIFQILVLLNNYFYLWHHAWSPHTSFFAWLKLNCFNFTILTMAFNNKFYRFGIKKCLNKHNNNHNVNNINKIFKNNYTNPARFAANLPKTMRAQVLTKA